MLQKEMCLSLFSGVHVVNVVLLYFVEKQWFHIDNRYMYGILEEYTVATR